MFSSRCRYYLQYRRLMYVQALQILKQSQAAEDAVQGAAVAYRIEDFE